MLVKLSKHQDSLVSKYLILLISDNLVKLLTHYLLCVSFCFLADRTNGRAYATVLRLSSSSVTLCIVAKRCVLEQKLLLRAYRKSYMRNRLVPKINDLDLCLDVVSRSRQPLRYI